MKSIDRTDLLDWPRRHWSRRIILCSMTLLFAASAMAQPAQTSKTVEKKKAPDPTANDLKIDPDRLPPGYEAPPDKLSIFDLERPIASQEEIKKLYKDCWTKFPTVRNNCDTSPAGKKVVEGEVRYRLAEMTVKEMLPKLPQIRKQFLTEVQQANPAKRDDEVKQFRDFVYDVILKQIPELLKNQFHVRLQAVELLGELDYYPAYELLMQVLQAPDIRQDEENGQPEAVKIAAAKSLIRIIRLANPPVKDRNVIALAIVDELKKTDTHPWLQYRLIEALRYSEITGIDAKNNDKPFVVDGLLSIVKDPERDWKVRTRACWALGRVALPKGSIKNDDLVTVIADCTLQLANAAAANPRNPEWKNCIWNIYLAFHKGGNPKEKDSDLDAERKPAGLLEKIRPAAQKAYDVIVPIVNDIMGNNAPGAGNLKALAEFVGERKPKADAAKVGNGAPGL